jgi:hypothetical protein
MSALPAPSPKLVGTSYELSTDSAGRRTVAVDLSLVTPSGEDASTQLNLTAQDLDRLIAQLQSAADTVGSLGSQSGE